MERPSLAFGKINGHEAALARVLKRKDKKALLRLLRDEVSIEECELLINKHRKAYLLERAKDFGILRIEKPKEKKKMTAEDASRILVKKRWDEEQIWKSLELCRQANLEPQKLVTMARQGVKANAVGFFIEVHRGLEEVVSAGGFEGEPSVRLISDVYRDLGNEPARVLEFVEFCKESVGGLDIEHIDQRYAPTVKQAITKLLSAFKALNKGIATDTKEIGIFSENGSADANGKNAKCKDWGAIRNQVEKAAELQKIDRKGF